MLVPDQTTFMMITGPEGCWRRATKGGALIVKPTIKLADETSHVRDMWKLTVKFASARTERKMS